MHMYSDTAQHDVHQILTGTLPDESLIFSNGLRTSWRLSVGQDYSKYIGDQTIRKEA